MERGRLTGREWDVRGGLLLQAKVLVQERHCRFTTEAQSTQRGHREDQGSCVLRVLCVSSVSLALRDGAVPVQERHCRFTTEAQRTQRGHREDQGSCVLRVLCESSVSLW